MLDNLSLNDKVKLLAPWFVLVLEIVLCTFYVNHQLNVVANKIVLVNTQQLTEVKILNEKIMEMENKILDDRLRQMEGRLSGIQKEAAGNQESIKRFKNEVKNEVKREGKKF